MKVKIDKNIIFIPLILALIFISSMNNQQAMASGSKDSNIYSIVSGNNGGTYYYIAAGQSKIIEDELGFNMSTQSTGGSPVENLTLVAQSPQNLGIVTLDGYYYGKEGSKERGFDKKIDNVQVLQIGHKAYLYGITMGKSDITSFGQLLGKKIAVPPIGSTTYYMALAVLEAYAINETNSSIISLSSSEQAEALKDEAIDAAFMAGGISQATVMDLDYSNKINFLSIDEETQKRIDKEHPYWNEGIIPKGTYVNQSADINCLTVNTMLVCNEDLDKDAAYAMTKILNEKTKALEEIHISGGEWSYETTLPFLDHTMLEFHPGALAYYNTLNSK